MRESPRIIRFGPLLVVLVEVDLAAEVVAEVVEVVEEVDLVGGFLLGDEAAGGGGFGAGGEAWMRLRGGCAPGCRWGRRGRRGRRGLARPCLPDELGVERGVAG
jgi:hypothetical protein